MPLFRIVAICFSLVLFLVPGLKNSQAQSEYSMRTITENDSLAQNHVYCLAQDARSFLWIGTGRGLSRFDGKTITNFRVADGLAENFVTAAATTPEGSIYFGHYEGSITFYNGNGFSIFRQSKAGKISALVYDAQTKYLWSFLQGGKVERLQGKKSVMFEPEVLTGKIINSVQPVASGFLVGTSEGLFTVLINEQHEIFEVVADPALEYVNVTAISKATKRNGYWIGTEAGGLQSLDKPGGAVQKLAGETFDAAYITDVKEDVYGDVWIATREKGLQRLSLTDQNTEREVVVFNANGIITGASQIYIDDEDGVWCGTQGEGLKLFVPQTVTFFDIDGQLKSGEIYSAISTGLRQYWVATENGLIAGEYNSESKEYYFRFHPDKNLQALTPKYLQHDLMRKRIWVASKNKGLAIYHTAESRIEALPAFSDHKVTYVETDRAGNSWIAVQSDGVFLVDSNYQILKHLNTTSGMLHNDISSICADADGNTWFTSTAAGVFMLGADGKFEYLTKDGQFPSYVVNHAVQNSTGALWFATGGEGIARLDSVSLELFRENNGMLSSYSARLLIDEGRGVWALHSKGLSFLSTQYQNAIRTYGRDYGIREISADNNVFFKDPSGDVWFADGGRLARFNAAHTHFNLYQRKPFLADIMLFRRHENLGQFAEGDSISDYIPSKIFLPHNKNHLTFQYTAVDLRGQATLFYKFKLEGYDTDWSPATREEATNYTNLAPGPYTFSVLTSDNPYVFPGAPLEYSFVIKKPYWELWWFYLAQIGGMALLFLLARLLGNTGAISPRKLRALRVMVFVLLFIVFEYLHEFLVPFTREYDESAPVVRVLINLVLAMVLLPIEELLKKFFIREPDQPPALTE